MTEETSEHIERNTMERLKGLADGIFRRYGVDFGASKRAGGWSNVTWIAGGLALRLAVRPGNENIRRDVRLGALLPPEVGYPKLVECGVTDGYEWALSQEVPGQCLGEAWDGLSWTERASALRQLWDKAQAVHSVLGDAVQGIARQQAWFNSNDPAEAEAGITRLVQQGLISEVQARNLRAALERFWTACASARLVLNHGDLTLDNAMWHQGQVVSVLDFEFALVAPLELDFNTLLKSALCPGDGPEDLAETDLRGQEQMRQAAIELARPVLARPGSRDLLLGYAVLLELWLLELWLAHPEGEGPLAQWDPYRRLLSLAGEDGGYLKAVLA